ncbi:MAG: NAD(P)H-binding protein [Burkholderiaceae bacterium]|jgi:nucleoside-diphosphate-sugar epimerase|nr:NAD(P)H-binding protein [Burkholderiaceae bacterium]
MRVLILGGAGFIGRRIVAALQRQQAWQVRVASRHPADPGKGVEVARVNSLDAASLRAALQGCDAVVNCVTGSGRTIVEGARQLAAALAASPCARVVHMSSMAAYGEIDGVVDDRRALGSGGGWYAQAKREAEVLLSAASGPGRTVVVLRPGCVHGPGSHLWVERFGLWLQAGRLGDLGAAGDGWSNLVCADDVAACVVGALEWCPTEDKNADVLTANLAAPDSPRWNAYLVALGVAIGATPVRRVPDWQLKLDSRLAAVPLRVWERLAPRMGLPSALAPPALAPSVLHLLQQDRRLVSEVATAQLGVRWTSFADSVAQSADWFNARKP